MAAHPLGQVLGHSAPACAPHQFPPAEPWCGGSSGAQLRLSVPWRVCLPSRWLGAKPWLSSSVEFVEKGCERLHLLPDTSVDTLGWLLGPSPSGRGEALSLCLHDGGRSWNWQGSATHKGVQKWESLSPSQALLCAHSILGNPLPYPGLGRELQPSLPGDLRGFCASLVLTFIWWESLP